MGTLLATAKIRSDGRPITTGLFFPGHKHPPKLDPDSREDMSVFDDLQRQLNEYFAGDRQNFDGDLDLSGTDFQRSVWRLLQTIPFATTVTYQSIADRLEKPKTVRAVGAAVGRNPISIIVPCHRVIGKNSQLTGFAGGLDRKRRLLELESGSI